MADVEKLGANLREATEHLAEYIEARAQEIAGPRIAAAERAALARIERAEAAHVRDRQRWEDVQQELRRHLASLDKQRDRLCTESPAAEIAQTLRAAAAGRREYMAAPPDEHRELLELQADTLDQAARIAAGDIEPLYELLPSWRWTDEMNKRVCMPGQG